MNAPTKSTDRRRHYGLAIGDKVEERAFGSSLRGTVIGFSPTDNNRAYLRLEDGTEHPAIAEYCRPVCDTYSCVDRLWCLQWSICKKEMA